VQNQGVVLDTSFFITLAGKDRKNHATARQYWKWMIRNGVPLYLPTIVVSEFYMRQELPPEIAKACITLPFNWEDAVQCAKLNFRLSEREEGTTRSEVKDDLKILAQAVVQHAAWVLTDDAGFRNLAKRLKSEGQSTCDAAYLGDGFDESIFDPSGQKPLFSSIPDEEGSWED